jgi:S-adenosylmethionine hydrolase
MIVLFTDFGPAGPYVGQMKSVLARLAADEPVIELLSDAPAGEAQPSAYLLAALVADFPADAVFLCVIDPGVGTDRAAIVVEADGRRFVGPDNGLFEIVLRRAAARRAWRITWRPERLSASFHGRDLFAPVAAMIARGDAVPGAPLDIAAVSRADWPDDLPCIVYIDHFGNAITGMRAAAIPPGAALEAAGRCFARGRTFGDVARGAAFWYENANGLAEIAVNRGRAAALDLAVGTPIGLTAAPGGD